MLKVGAQSPDNIADEIARITKGFSKSKAEKSAPSATAAPASYGEPDKNKTKGGRRTLGPEERPRLMAKRVTPRAPSLLANSRPSAKLWRRAEPLVAASLL